MALPSIDFDEIARTAKEALVAYGTDAEFIEKNATVGRTVKAVVYRDVGSVVLKGDLDLIPATAILNPDDFRLPFRMPAKFDKIRVSTGGFSRMYTIESTSPITAKNTLPLILAQLRGQLMSSSIVRTAFRQALATGFPAVPYVDSIAYEHDQELLPKTWVTLEFTPLAEVRETLDVPSWWTQTGTCYVVIADEAGAGDSTAVQLGDAIGTYFRGWSDPNDSNFVVTETSEPSQPDAESEGRWFFVVVNVQYTRRFLQ